MLVVDAHTHIFPPEFIRRKDHLVESDHWFGHLYDLPDALLATDADLLASMDSACIQHAVACGFPWSDQGLCREHNAWMAEVVRNHPDRISFIATVVPQDVSAARDAELAISEGAVGIGELNADGQDFDLSNPESIHELMEVCRLHSKPVMLHASEPVGHLYPGKGKAVPEKLVHWLTAFQSQTIVLAHWGGGLPFYELMPEIARVTQMVYYDSAATSYLYRQQVFAVVCALVGADRIIFGTDYPVLSQQRLLDRTKKSMATVRDLKKILGETAREVYQLAAVTS